MSYFITGATGFIGRRLVDRLRQRGGKIRILVRKQSVEAAEELVAGWGDDVEVVVGDITQANFGLSEAEVGGLRGQVDHMFHLAAAYDLLGPVEDTKQVNVVGTQHVVDFANSVEVGCLHLVSSIAAAGLFKGVFREDMFKEATGLDHPYYRTKHDSEGLVRDHCTRPWRVYRPGVVVGDSRTGEMDKIDGPYYFFKAIQKMRYALPQWMPTVGVEGGRINIVPVDFVVNAMDHIAHAPDEDGGCFHLVDPKPHRIGDVLNIFARAAHAPEMTMRVNASMFAFIPPFVRSAISALGPVKTIKKQVLDGLGLPESVFQFVTYPTKFDCRQTARVLAGSGIEVPALESYAHRLWDYWERNLDPDLFIDRSLRGRVEGEIVVVTGASSGIGRAASLALGEAGAQVILVARGRDKLIETQREIEAAGGTCFVYTCNISDMESCDELVARVKANHPPVSILINNAGRSIRRAINASYDRFHDFERTMQLNYFGALRLILGFLPDMAEAGRGHVINISSIGVLTNAARFSAYVASKSALDAFGRCARSEYAGTGVTFTSINMPLVRTPMIAPTKFYRSLPAISPEEASDMIVEAIIYRPERIATRLGKFARAVHAISPKTWEALINTGFRMFPDSHASSGEGGSNAASPEQIAMSQLMRGIHW
jgi:NAD(P)-dependent dehydrogenase (short-subunit alcohol dehydrogenase family)